MSKLQTLGWDIGGAHLKAVLLNADGELLGTLQVACPLWRGLDNLSSISSFREHCREILEGLNADGV